MLLLVGPFTNLSYSLEVGGDISASNIFLGQMLVLQSFLINNASISGIVTANEFLSESDLRLKKNIRPIDNVFRNISTYTCLLSLEG